MKNKQWETFRLGELFCGPGGLALGTKLATVKCRDGVFSITHAWATDYDHDSCETYRLNICPDSPQSVVRKDIRKLDFNRLRKISGIDAFSFGFPCNDFSVVGEQKGINGTYGPLYAYGVEAVRFFKPKFFLAENVKGLRNSNDGTTFSLILKELFDAGYSVYPHLYSFNQYGVPQTRQRIIIIGIRNNIDVIFKIPSSKPFEKRNVSCRKAIESPPIPKNAPNNELTRQSKTVIERLRYIKPGENAFTADLPKHLQLNVRGAKISQIYKRLDPDKPAYTVTGSGGGGTHMYHWKENRALTNRERARLQTFPDDFIFAGSKESVRKQIGMAVPCFGAKVIFESVLKCFAGLTYPHIAPNIEPLIHPSHIELYNSKATGQMRICEEGIEYKSE
ncbi:MAG: DNA (cytosine-5-)-methyltransferase [Deltaproteobacteria bacterium]|nr:DNA (cytosine-5-)-methyltransferase [Deltaproteobacteria bacterium]